MDMFVITGFPAMPSWLVPFMIFFARIVDVSLGTMRILVVGRGMRGAAALLGFVEVFIWLLAIGQVLAHLDGLLSYLSYSAGFAAGTFVGMTIERRLTLGTSLIRIVVPGDAAALIDRMKACGHRLTHLEAQGTRRPVHIIFSVVRQKGLKGILELVREVEPEAFYSVEDVRAARDISSDEFSRPSRHHLLQPFFWFRKSK